MAKWSQEQIRIKAALRQREFRQRQKQQRAQLEAKLHKQDVLENSIKLASIRGDSLALSIQAVVHYPTVDNLADYFRTRAERPVTARSLSRNKQKAG